MEQTVGWIFAGLGAYLAVGLGFAVIFVMWGVQQVDPTARDGASIGFRLAILPATAALWPLMLKRWVSGQQEPPEECSPHRCAACAGSCERKETT